MLPASEIDIARDELPGKFKVLVSRTERLIGIWSNGCGKSSARDNIDKNEIGPVDQRLLTVDEG